MSPTAHRRRKPHAWESEMVSNVNGQVSMSLASVTKHFQTLQSYCTPEMSSNASKGSDICHGGHGVLKAATFPQRTPFDMPMYEQSTHIPRGKRFKLPLFYGKDCNEFIVWLFAVEMYFDRKHYSDQKECELVLSCLKGHTLKWYRRFDVSRMKQGKGEISSWHKLKMQMKRKVLPSYVMNELIYEMQTLKQNLLSVKDYIQRFKELSFICEVHEKTEHKNIRFYVGLNLEIGMMFDLNLEWSFEELCDKALEFEGCLKDNSMQPDISDLVVQTHCSVDVSKRPTCSEIINSTELGLHDETCSENHVVSTSLSLECMSLFEPAKCAKEASTTKVSADLLVTCFAQNCGVLDAEVEAKGADLNNYAKLECSGLNADDFSVLSATSQVKPSMLTLYNLDSARKLAFCCILHVLALSLEEQHTHISEVMKLTDVLISATTTPTELVRLNHITYDPGGLGVYENVFRPEVLYLIHFSRGWANPHAFRDNATLLMLDPLDFSWKLEPCCIKHGLVLYSELQQTHITHVFDPGGKKTAPRDIQARKELAPTSEHLFAHLVLVGCNSDPEICGSVLDDCNSVPDYEATTKREFLILIFDPGGSRACESTRRNTLMLVFAPSALFTSLAVQVHMVLKWRRSGVPMPFDDLGLWITKFEDKFFSNKGSMQQEQGVGGSHFL